jgi:predicted ABC-type ATPase
VATPVRQARPKCLVIAGPNGAGKATLATEFLLWLSGPTLARRRVDARIRSGGHAVAPADIDRRFTRGWSNFRDVYRPLADRWVIYDNSGSAPRRVEEGP